MPVLALNIAEQRIAAHARQFHAAQQRTHRRRQAERNVGMPKLVGVARFRRTAVGLGPRGDNGQLRLLRIGVGRTFVFIEFAKAAAERDVLLARDRLAAKQQYRVLEKRAMYLCEIGITHRPREIEADHLCAQRVG
jgi:hypothetical protein